MSYAQNSLFLSIVLRIAYGLISVFASDWLISFFNIREAGVAKDASKYLSTVGLAVPCFFINSDISGVFIGLGTTLLSTN